MTFVSASFACAGKTFGSTIVEASVVSTYCQVLSCEPRVKTTLSVPCAATFFIDVNSTAGPFGSLMARMRVNEYTTAAASRASPLENFSQDFSVQVKVTVAVKPHEDAASGDGTVAPGATLSKFW